MQITRAKFISLFSWHQCACQELLFPRMHQSPGEKIEGGGAGRRKSSELILQLGKQK